MKSGPPCAPAATRNAAAILGVLEVELAGMGRVLEIGSGTAEHAVRFAPALGRVTWQTSDLEEMHPGIHRQLEHAGVTNVLPPVVLDVMTAQPGSRRYDAVFSANTLHIMPAEATARMAEFVAEVLRTGGAWCCYGPFRREGAYTSPSNAAFDASLRSRDARMGLRDLEVVCAHAESAGLVHRRTYAMPANNLLIVWQKVGVADD